MSHFGPPTAPKMTASAFCALAIAASVMATPCLSIGRAADQIALGRELARVALALKKAIEALDLGHRLDADAVAGKQEQVVGGHAVKGPDGGRKSAVLLAAGACRGKGRAAQKAPEKKSKKPFSVDSVPSPARMALSTSRIVPPVMMATDARTMAICNSAWP